jgi:hypothetical protein
VPEISSPSLKTPQGLVAALANAKAGMAVFPVRADKTPLTPHGCKRDARSAVDRRMVAALSLRRDRLGDPGERRRHRR